ncbi:PREDICTED: MOB kinase activator-like 2 isoform X1 [Drosophila arizonae]|uniref:MOB kinase activator-like 2 isoform X1 n=1 Tax=Drosophila arizonae TaxID=7263 RepID=A0ABM1P401_DROAR|nr:PREDICTED: MOB kinase activator-like 2 isoform X1 [Drosophila arizonae]
MNWAISNLTGGNRVSRAILVRYSSVPLAEDGGSSMATTTPAAGTPRASNSAMHSSLSSTFAATFLRQQSSNSNSNNNNSGSSNSSSSNHNNSSSNNNHSNSSKGQSSGAASGAGSNSGNAQLSLPLDVEETVTCFCRKARRKERDGDQNSTDTKLYLEESVLERKLPEADLKALVDLPAGLDYNEWLASHTLALFEHVNLVYGTISEFCTQSGCADMTGPGNRTYLWFDEKGKKTRVAAPQYIDYVMTFTQKTVSDELIFPTKYANEFPGSFESIARKILRLQFHVIAHLYAAHFREIALLGLHTHLNLTFMHLTALHRRFNLIDEKETDVLRDLEVALRLTDDNSVCGQDSQTDSGSASASASISVSGSNSEQQQQQQSQLQQQQPHNNSSSNSNNSNISNSSAEALHVNSQSSCGTSLIDGDAAAPPICTQPEPGAGGKPPGSGGLLGGILGDLTSGEFGDTTRYCTSAVPPHATAAAAAGTDASGHASPANGATNGAAGGALHLNFSNNNSNNHNLNHLNHHHHHHTHHHHHHHPHTHLHHLHQHHGTAAAAGPMTATPTAQHSGLIQCNAAGAATATATVTSASASATAGGGGSGNSNT